MRSQRVRIICGYSVLTALLIVLVVLNICAGSADISPSRLGGALAVSGFLLQNFFANPIAGPYILGISSGAKLMVALLMVFSLSRGFAVSSFGMIFAAFIGSMASMALILLIS